ncbi:glycosyltransferase [Deinococcus arenicola]|uniref:Glycosyltransferase n=1 Tax=Deinococcus arenicola TaxID=2994950 RepID=A0ABU4DSI7_9DEIO|nr:glycosyltransferase [Deinococcus sp. ZS9-10]MDV6375390.1 glycosyltransferase [Deinococcus sp. ZS9-10]
MTTDSKTKVLVFMGAYLPGFKGGGPVTSIKNLVDRLSSEIEFRVVAPDRDLFSETAYPDVPIREWTQLGKEKVLYLPPSLLNVIDVWAALHLTPHDVVYLNSFFSPRYTIPVLALRRLGLIPKKAVVLAVRGEFAPAALDLKSRKKQIYLKLAQKTGLLKNVLFHATNTSEEQRIHDILGPAVRTHLAPPLTRSPTALNRKPEVKTDRLQVVFLGRIAPMKNLDYALKVLAEVKTPVHFTIYGPTEDAKYWSECQQLISKLPEHISVNYAGSIAPDKVQQTLSQFDLFFLPTRGENFGHVIAEALAAGCPVLISDQTPWNDLESNGCGWALPLTNQIEFSGMIDSIARMTTINREETIAKCLEYAAQKNNSGKNKNLSIDLFINNNILMLDHH